MHVWKRSFDIWPIRLTQTMPRVNKNFGIEVALKMKSFNFKILIISKIIIMNTVEWYYYSVLIMNFSSKVHFGHFSVQKNHSKYSRQIKISLHAVWFSLLQKKHLRKYFVFFFFHANTNVRVCRKISNLCPNVQNLLLFMCSVFFSSYSGSLRLIDKEAHDYLGLFVHLIPI